MDLASAPVHFDRPSRACPDETGGAFGPVESPSVARVGTFSSTAVTPDVDPVVLHRSALTVVWFPRVRRLAEGRPRR